MVDEQQEPNAAQPNPWAAPGSYTGSPSGPGEPRPHRSSQRRSPLVVAAAVFTVSAIGVSPLIYKSVRATDPTISSSQASQGQSLVPNSNWPGQDDNIAGTGDPRSGSTAAKASSSLSRGVVLVDTVLPGGQGAGTGVILTDNGQVLTSYHVVNGSTSIKVTVAATGKAYSAEVVGHDQGRDIALLKLKDASGLNPVTVDQDAVNPGTNITAVGNASGQGYLTQVQGTVTALDRSITASSDGGAPAERLTGLLQTTAGVVPGDSGGPVYDAQGEVLGINAAASASNQNAGQTGAPIQSFAVPITTAMNIVDQIRSGDESGNVVIGPKAFLGISMSGASRGTGGVAVAGVTAGGAAARAGLVAGDTITSIEDVPTSTTGALSDVVSKHDPGDSVRVTWLTDAGAAKHATIPLGQSPLN